MESISSENLPIVSHTLDQIELAIERLQERTKNIQTVDDFLSTPGGMEKLDAACMVLIAIGESIKNLDKVSEGKDAAKNTVDSETSGTEDANAALDKDAQIPSGLEDFNAFGIIMKRFQILKLRIKRIILVDLITLIKG